ncbi:hypothetical protein PPSIR1_20879 [Plesiocystis pacifica SIR-1]|uniref:Uncharacterized protein n=2 Tax=Plesiocystis pacifica TaxID=191768 RepID=A6GGU1_9BACT|nr:hypothetical protein PPSIR1_20879 [Plesiocystis pacifica SIR-1]
MEPEPRAEAVEGLIEMGANDNSKPAAIAADTFIFHSTFMPFTVTGAAVGRRGALGAELDALRQELGLFEDVPSGGSDVFTELPELGYLFLERTRVRPLGYTIEQAPFYQLSLAPAEVVTLRQRSFSRRQTTLTEEAERETERSLEYSSSLTTDFEEEFSKSLSETFNWGVTQNISGGYNTGVWNVNGSTSVNVSSSESSSESAREASKIVEKLARKVETKQKARHKTAVSISQESTYEDESVRTIRNDTHGTKKLLMRRVMQVRHVSHERYDMRLCWSPSIPSPAKNFSTVSSGKTKTLGEFRAALADLEPQPGEIGFAKKPADEIVTIGPIDLTKIQDDKEGTEQLVLEEGMAYAELLDDSIVFTNKHGNYAIAFRYHDGTRHYWGSMSQSELKKWFEPDIEPNDTKLPEPGTEASQGTVRLSFRYLLSNDVFSPGHAKVEFKVRLEPTEQRKQAWHNAVEQWRDEQAQVQYGLQEEELATLESEIGEDTLVPSQLMNRIIDRYFQSLRDGDFDSVELLHRVFEWEELQATLYAPWWDGDTDNDASASQTEFWNASWAKLYIPVRAGFEREAVLLLIRFGALEPSTPVLGSVEARVNSLPADRAALRDPATFDGAAIHALLTSPQQIELTERDADSWTQSFEEQSGFTVLNSFLITLPTDGVDIEEQIHISESSAQQLAYQREVVDLELRGQVKERLDTSDINIGVSL